MVVFPPLMDSINRLADTSGKRPVGSPSGRHEKGRESAFPAAAGGARVGGGSPRERAPPRAARGCLKAPVASCVRLCMERRNRRFRPRNVKTDASLAELKNAGFWYIRPPGTAPAERAEKRDGAALFELGRNDPFAPPSTRLRRRSFPTIRDGARQLAGPVFSALLAPAARIR